ncbi:uncharacterized protein SPSK_10000 [Sporothrix schenckii 1099-18]|uniref:Uncharacterized protein n=1 Tax=Sporothrix schenckii 1099-18 TaxID=1397361 RepID=A0A0F2M9F4_SPOSC|nr:uncharacterized protein SPSK_10000 [Sporothrix schenckii 1099-18]KJR84791.1 hypothetical protein SPSK_10000 [Sporothrix schenckii 1099-18]
MRKDQTPKERKGGENWVHYAFPTCIFQDQLLNPHSDHRHPEPQLATTTARHTARLYIQEHLREHRYERQSTHRRRMSHPRNSVIGLAPQNGRTH